MNEQYMRRCLDLALLGQGYTRPNPMVGAVLVHNDRIIGEGYHAKYGEAHAEVNCIDSVTPEDRHLVTESTLYVSLEPCAHFGKTPPCADRIIHEKIPRVVIGCPDPFEQVQGRGISKLLNAGVQVEADVMEDECKALNKRFFRFHQSRRPYVILKWAETEDHIMGRKNGERLLISQPETSRLVHRWRSEEAAILVGTSTVLADNPILDNRLWPGPKPVRLVLDRNLRLPQSLQVFDGMQPTVIFNGLKHEVSGSLQYYQVDKEAPVVSSILSACYNLQLQSVLVEGGAQLLSAFITAGLWDEARVIINRELRAGNGIKAPSLQYERLIHTEELNADTVFYYVNEQPK